jgi:hypothetical protein
VTRPRFQGGFMSPLPRDHWFEPGSHHR